MRHLYHDRLLTIFVLTVLLIHAQAFIQLRTIIKVTSFGSSPLFNGDRFLVRCRKKYNSIARNYIRTTRKGNKDMDFKGNRIASVHGSSNLDFNGNKIRSVHDLNGSTHSFSSIIRSIGDSDQLLVVLVGIPGSGKSTVALRIANGADKRWKIACQDVLKSRGAVLEYASEALMKRDSVIIDRCNFDPVQRQHWTKLADEKQEEMRFKYEYNLNDSTSSTFPRILKLCLVLPKWNDVVYCANRAFSRGDDGVHEINTNWSDVCHRMNRDFRMPSLDEENFDALHVCVDENDVNRTIRLLTTGNG